jgi:hypothetical protein
VGLLPKLSSRAYATVMKQFARSALAPYAIYLILLIAFGMRLFRLDQPKGFIFDELYYVNGHPLVNGQSPLE